MTRRGVSTGELSNAGVEITDGLESRDKVITAGVSRIYAGLTVALPEAAEVDG